MGNYESIKEKLLKMQALAEKGYQGEAETAKRMIEILCQRYGVSIEDILSEQVKTKRYEFEIGKNKRFKTLFNHCYFKIFDKNEMDFYRRSPSKIALDLTPLQYTELSSLFEWHKANFIKDMEETLDTMESAYLNKHDLFPSQNGGNPDRELTPEDIKRIKAMFAMMANLSNNTYHKMIEQKSN